MLEPLLRRGAALLLLGSLALTSCSSFSQASRHQRAYQKYVTKTAGTRYKQKMKLNKQQAKLTKQQNKQKMKNVTPVALQPTMTEEGGGMPLSASSSSQ